MVCGIELSSLRGRQSRLMGYRRRPKYALFSANSCLISEPLPLGSGLMGLAGMARRKLGFEAKSEFKINS